MTLRLAGAVRVAGTDEEAAGAADVADDAGEEEDIEGGCSSRNADNLWSTVAGAFQIGQLSLPVLLPPRAEIFPLPPIVTLGMMHYCKLYYPHHHLIVHKGILLRKQL